MQDYVLTPRSEIERRIASIQALLAERDLDGALLVQLTDLLYFSGTSQQAHLLVPRAGAPLLMVRCLIDGLFLNCKY
jgi:Xaa-Pro aminopeptidase